MSEQNNLLNIINDVALRHNQGKVDFTEIPFDCLAEVAKVFQTNKTKYPDNADGTPNWSKLWGDKTTRVAMASALRHSAAILSGEVRDKESELYHAAHIVCNMFFIIRYNLENKL